jgi:cellulose synthase/poly-beta-1,6-N-acetylglucosamine synthase-like glycosyltransferase
MYVVERLLEAVSKINYPRDLLEIQVLDGSTDVTKEIAYKKVKELREKGFDIHYIPRDNEAGYKAGALLEGLNTAKGELIAIFDADFLPDPEFLYKTVHFFTDEKVGVVQTRWGHLNNAHSTLTEAQSILLDGHLILEQTARNRSGRFMQFNGSAGIWRKKAIEDAGNWHTDTLTEDLDLSFRAQLRGWKFIFLRDVVTPGELPVEMSGFKSQQLKWAMGSTWVAKKLIKSIFTAKIPFFIKLDVLIDLAGYSLHFFLLLIALLILPSIQYSIAYDLKLYGIFQGIIFIWTMISFCLFYLFSQIEAYDLRRGLQRFLRYFPMLLVLGTGFCINNTWGVLSALFRNKPYCIRTPKLGDCGVLNIVALRNYRNNKSFLSLIEFGMGLYFLYLVWYSVNMGYWTIIPFELLFMVSFFYVAFFSFFHGKMVPNLAKG